METLLGRQPNPAARPGDRLVALARFAGAPAAGPSLAAAGAALASPDGIVSVSPRGAQATNASTKARTAGATNSRS
ncbi:MAG: hypothetical protein EOO75_20925, partial [Myxococcales bacterium]